MDHEPGDDLEIAKIEGWIWMKDPRKPDAHLRLHPRLRRNRRQRLPRLPTPDHTQSSASAWWPQAAEPRIVSRFLLPAPPPFAASRDTFGTQPLQVLGIDCAAQAKKVGLAYSRGSSVLGVVAGVPDPAGQILDWVDWDLPGEKSL